ncbi:hypothetical protein [Mesorhizobium sp.]|uniref:hypothetical protein n=1 Tax=Mesorhizobium sp. TaxID=1871066 RepID=UPI000FE58007|nr:hypothetical protein [Mesorhizobium sp.]RWB65993.1 MAG: hypothetical protein EOQ49_30395 [Mesorhizobium sp.]TIT08033.1 MAG: hypothetical protein E5W74_24590 [Mesorhizobium sp.]TIV82861.1 MAG: hypothetical protein E5V64_10480 [Mesorhizobium sp.]
MISLLYSDMRFENTTENAQTACFGVELFSNPRKSETAVTPAEKTHPKPRIGLQLRSPLPQICANEGLRKEAEPLVLFLKTI